MDRKWGETNGQTRRGFSSKRMDNGLKQGSGHAEEGVATDTGGRSARGLECEGQGEVRVVKNVVISG